MTVINPSSISGITSITMPSGDGNVLTIHTNDGTERFRIDSSGNVKVGSACTISQDGDVFFTGVTTATTYAGSGANLTNLPAANITGTLPAISGENLTGIAVTDNVRTGILDVAGIATFRDTVNMPNINGGQIGGRRNIIINGAMNVAQRSTSATTNNGYGSVDRFQVVSSATDETPTHQQVNVTSGTPYESGFRKCLKVTNGNQTGGAGATDTIKIQYAIEAQDMATCGWHHDDANDFVTLSFWVRSSVAQNFYGALVSSDGTALMYNFETGSLSADTWTKVTKTIPGNASLAFNNDNGNGLEFRIFQYLGTDYTNNSVSNDAWAGYGNPQTKVQTTTWYTTNDATFELTGVQLELGTQATPFEHRSYNDEHKLCERYYQTSFERGQEPTHGVTKYIYRMTRPFASSTVTGMGCELRTEMRATPTTTIYTTSNGSNSTTNRVSYYDGSWTSGAISIHESCNTKSIAFDGTLSASTVLYQFNYRCESEL